MATCKQMTAIPKMLDVSLGFASVSAQNSSLLFNLNPFVIILPDSFRIRLQPLLVRFRSVLPSPLHATLDHPCLLLPVLEGEVENRRKPGGEIPCSAPLPQHGPPIPADPQTPPPPLPFLSRVSIKRQLTMVRWRSK